MDATQPLPQVKGGKDGLPPELSVEPGQPRGESSPGDGSAAPRGGGRDGASDRPGNALDDGLPQRPRSGSGGRPGDAPGDRSSGGRGGGGSSSDNRWSALTDGRRSHGEQSRGEQARGEQARGEQARGEQAR
ncbi:hypothetical protein LR394_32100, partial [Kineosporia babensis]